ncbi:Hypothetical predicted protein [Mytilus galloprovincialis]|uniref:Uncharacterized protein n=1 Tax=Mytilus galloprovincialis TaxID=29158 RepID=A0A8B6GLH4_MYTGA|nr:Hypothetical predicted protein [Mytilus galloprovincialis]
MNIYFCYCCLLFVIATGLSENGNWYQGCFSSNSSSIDHVDSTDAVTKLHMNLSEGQPLNEVIVECSRRCKKERYLYLASSIEEPCFCVNKSLEDWTLVEDSYCSSLMLENMETPRLGAISLSDVNDINALLSDSLNAIQLEKLHNYQSAKFLLEKSYDNRLKNRSVRLRDDKAFMVLKKDFTEFCSPSRLDDNIEEGLSSTMGNKKKGFVDRKKFSHSLPSFHKEMDAEFEKVDNSARTSVSYGSLIASYIDVADSEEDRVEACSALVACFKSMADMTSPTSAKLLNLPLNGAQLFGGKYFDTLHSSAENIRDAKETQNVYRSSFVPGGQKFDEGSRKRKSQETSNVTYGKPAKTSRYDKQDFNDRRGTDTSSNFRALPAKQGGKGSFLWKNSSKKNFKR